MSQAYDKVTAAIVERLERGVVPWRKPWRTGPSGGPANIISGKPYRGVNVFVLGTASYASRWWLTYRQAAALGGHVRRGEHGSPVIFWNWKEREEQDLDSGKVVKRGVPLLRYFTVFNTEQCEGIPAAKIPAPTVTAFNPIEEAERIVKGYLDSPVVKYGGDRACYYAAADTIEMPMKEAFTGPEEHYSTLFHELAHSTGHEKRLARASLIEASPFGAEAYSKEELVAEMGCAFLCGEAGISPKVIDNSAAYIASWLSVLKRDRRLVVVAAAQAQRATDWVLGKRKEAEVTAYAAADNEAGEEAVNAQ